MNEEMLVSCAEIETPPADAAAQVYRGAPRTQLPDRNQMGWEEVCLDTLISADHQVRIVWAFVEEQDLSPLYELILAREDRPGRTPIAPKRLVARWLDATRDVAALMAEGLVTLNRVAQDGMDLVDDVDAEKAHLRGGVHFVQNVHGSTTWTNPIGSNCRI